MPDELCRWMQATVAGLQAQYAALAAACRAALTAAGPFPNRKAAAAFIQAQPYPPSSGGCSTMLDGKPYAELIWKQLRPAFEVPPQGARVS